MRSFFNAENGLWQIFGFIGDAVVLSLLWTVCSAPVITAGAATAALYDTVTACFRRHEQDYLRRFFRTLKRELVGSLLPTVLWAALLALLYMGYSRIAAGLSGSGGVLLASGMLFLLLIPLGICGWVFPMLSRFTLDFKSLQVNAVRVGLGYLPRTLLIAALIAVSFWLTLRLQLLPLFFLPAIVALLDTYLMEPVFRKYEGDS